MNIEGEVTVKDVVIPSTLFHPNPNIQAANIVNEFNIDEIYFGGARGVDTRALYWAHKYKKPNTKLIVVVPDTIDKQPAETRGYINTLADEVIELKNPITKSDGFAAYQIRNEYMVNPCDLLISFWNGQKKNCGTYNCMEYATSKNKTIRIVNIAGSDGAKNKEIYFYSTKGEFGCFSNFSSHSFILKDKKWNNSESYFQAQKFAGTSLEEEIRNIKSPTAAANIGRDKKNKLRDNWEGIKDNIMYDAVLAKFSQNKDIKDILLATDGQTLIEDSPIDFYWGCGANRTGKNKLGKILMKVRDKLKIDKNMEK